MRRSQKLLEFTCHATERMEERAIEKDDIKSALKTGIIIELNKEANPWPTCLVLGKTCQGDPLHVAVALADNCFLILTAYVPDVEIWGENLDKKVVV